MSNSTLTLLKITNLARTHVELLPVADVGGLTGEPALSLCTDVLSELLAHPYDWKFNRVEMPMLVTAPFKQDYLFAGACAFSLGSTSQGWAVDLASADALTQSGGTVTLKFLEAPNFAAGDVIYLNNLVLKSDGSIPSAYNATLTQVPGSSTWSGGQTVLTVSGKTVTFAGSTSETSGAPGITNFGWICAGSLVEMNNTGYPQYTVQIQTYFDLMPVSRSANPDKVCILVDYGTGVLKVRFREVPGTIIWGANLIYQAKAPLKAATDLSDTWAPFPDEYSYVFRQGFLAHAYRYVNSSRADTEYQKFQLNISKALVQGDREQEDIRIYPESSLQELGADTFGGII